MNLNESARLSINPGHNNGLSWIYDVKNYYEMGVNLILLILNFCLIILIMFNMLRIRSWSKKEEVNEGKLMCINSNNICVCIVRLIYGSSLIKWASVNENYEICIYFLFQSLSYYWMNFLYMIVTFHWTKFYLSIKYKRMEFRYKLGMFIIRVLIYLIALLALLSILMLAIIDKVDDDLRINKYFISIMISLTTILAGFSFVCLSYMTLRYLRRFFEGDNSAMMRARNSFFNTPLVNLSRNMTLIVIPCIFYRVFYNFCSIFDNNFFIKWRYDSEYSWAFGFELSYFFLTDIFPSYYLLYLYSPNMKAKSTTTTASSDDPFISNDEVLGQNRNSQEYLINK